VNLPLSAAEVDLHWLNEALRAWTPGVEIRDIERRTVLEGTATKILLRVRYRDGVVPGGPPADLCVKGGFNEDMRHAVANAYQIEANFYTHVAHQLNIPLPRCWFACCEPERKQGIIVLDDMVAAGAHFTNLLQPWSADRVAAALETQAKWHGQTWGATPQRYPWFRVGTWVRDVADVACRRGVAAVLQPAEFSASSALIAGSRTGPSSTRTNVAAG